MDKRIDVDGHHFKKYFAHYNICPFQINNGFLWYFSYYEKQMKYLKWSS